MNVVALGPLPVASILWQPRPGAWVLTVVARATYLLRPGEASLAPSQEAPAEDDRHWGDDPAQSLRQARDIVPVKPNAEVVLVGSAFAPERRAVRSVVARLTVGEVDKSIEVVAERFVRPDGSIQEGPPFTQAPLRYERAAGGPGTWNPVGVPRSARDAEGRMILPTLYRPGAAARAVHAAVEPVGFGPIAPSWPERRDRLGTAASWSFRDIASRPLPEGMDLGYFNAAPRDQHLRVLSGTERISLENLHPEHAQLVTTLPGYAPQATLEGRRTGPVAIAMRADTLWIDADRSLCTLTFRGFIPLEAAHEQGQVVVRADRVRPAEGEAALLALAKARVPPELQMTSDLPLSAPQAVRPVLPFTPSVPATPAAVRDSALIPAPALHEVQRTPEPSPWASGAPRPEIALPPAVPLPARPAAVPGALEASNAASAAPATALRAEPLAAGPALEEAAPAPRTEIAEAIELVWYDAESVPSIRKKAEWRPLLDALERVPLDPDVDDPAFTKDPMQIEDRREIFEVIAHASPLDPDGLDAALARCLRDDGKFVPALALFTGELELPFDELASLRATLTTVSPLAGADEALKGAIQAAKEFLATPGLMSAPAVAEGLTKRIEDAFAQGKRVVATGYLEAQRERALLEQRQYQRRSVLGGKHLRGLLRPSGAEPAAGVRLGSGGKQAGAVPVYLPESIAEELPMYPRFRARVIAVLRLAADRYETHPAALRALALARLVTPPRG
jgi:hypothetical protein